MIHKLFDCFSLAPLAAPAFLVVVDLLVLLNDAVLLLVELAPQLLLSVFLLDHLHDLFVGGNMEVFGSFLEGLAIDSDFFLLPLLDCQDFGCYLSLCCSLIQLLVAEFILLFGVLFSPRFNIALDLLQFVDALGSQWLIP